MGDDHNLGPGGDQSNLDRYEIERYRKLTQDQLLIQFGRDLMSGAVHGGPVNDDELLRTGERWFTSFRARAKTAICTATVLEQLQGPNAHRNTIAGLVINYLLASNLDCPVPLGSVAVALVNY